MTTHLPHVWNSAEACKELSNVLERFRQDGIEAQPMVIGSRQNPEAVVIPYELYERIATLIEHHEIAELIRERSAEGPAKPIDELFTEFIVELN